MLFKFNYEMFCNNYIKLKFIIIVVLFYDHFILRLYTKKFNTYYFKCHSNYNYNINCMTKYNNFYLNFEIFSFLLNVLVYLQDLIVSILNCIKC